MKEISLVIPVFDAAAFIKRSLEELCSFLSGLGQSFEIIVVNDGSNDGTKELLDTLELSGLRVFHLPSNQGKGAAVCWGMAEAEGKCRISTDADLPYDLRAIPLAWELTTRQGFHLAVGDRSLKGSNYFEQLEPLRFAATKLFSAMVRLLVAGEMFDTQCGFKAFRGDIAAALFPLLRCKGFAFDVELLYIALKYNLAIRRIPVRYRRSEESTVQPAMDGAKMLLQLPSFPLNWRLGRYRSVELERLAAIDYW